MGYNARNDEIRDNILAALTHNPGPLQGKIDKMVIVADQAGHDGMTTEKILAALDKPRKLYSILMVVNPSGSLEELQQKLLKMRDEGLVKFDIHKGRWYLPK